MKSMRQHKHNMTVAVIVALSVVGCCATSAPRPPHVTYSANHNLLTVGYDADRFDSIVRAQREAERYCWNYENHQKVFIVDESTIYQGQFDQELTEAAKAAGKAGSVFGAPDVDKASRILSSGIDYKTTIEFQCQ